jgi:threonine dehydrogenase-like Zn-dependent dehydrogenase
MTSVASGADNLPSAGLSLLLEPDVDVTGQPWFRQTRLEYETRMGAKPNPEAVLECVGANSALELAFACLRPGGVLSSIGVNTSPSFPFTPDDAYNKNVTFRSGRCPARSMMPLAARLLSRLRARGVDVAAALVTHRLPLQSGAQAYEVFAARTPGCDGSARRAHRYAASASGSCAPRPSATA